MKILGYFLIKKDIQHATKVWKMNDLLCLSYIMMFEVRNLLESAFEMEKN